MVSARPSPTPAGGRIPYPTADTLTPGDAFRPPQMAAARLEVRRGSSPADVTAQQSGTGLQRLRSMRDRVRDRSSDRSQERTPVGRDRSGSVAVGMLSQNRDQQQPKDKDKDLLEREKSTQGLKTWWKSFSANRSSTPSPPPYQSSFRHTGTTTTTTMNTRKVFGVPLARVLTYASMQISTSGPDGELYVWGEVPIIVGRCGAYLKSKSDIEGLFRVSGSAKRMRDLQAIFDDGPSYGGDIDWATSQFTPHDVATMFRRYFTQMPESVIPAAYYEQFRSVQANGQLTTEMKIRDYKRLIRALPTEHKFLLLYTLDLLGIVDKQSDKNLMNAANLALIFQPGLLTHPGHEMRPSESALSKDVVEFLITHQHQFVMAMAMKLSKRRSQAHGHGHEGHAHSHTHHGRGNADPTAKAETGVVRPAAQRLASTDSALTYMTAPEASLSQTQLAIPEAIPESGQVPASPTTASTVILSPSTSTMGPTLPSTIPPQDRPKAVRADTDYLLPSDSDEEAPPGGYFIVEARPRTASPRLPLPTSPTSPTSSTSTPFSVQGLFAPPPQPRSKRGRPSLPNLPSQVPVPAIDVMDPSDSDDDAPPGGYIVYENRIPSSSPSPASTPLRGASLHRSHTGRGALQSAEGRTNSPKPSEGATGLLRRKTLPSKRVGDFTARMRRAVRDA